MLREGRLVRIGAATVGAVLAGLIALAIPQLSAANSTCSDGGACTWITNDFTGEKFRIGQGHIDAGWVSLPDTDCCARSAKNRFTNRKLLLADEFGGQGGYDYCINPGGNRSGNDFGNSYATYVKSFRVGDVGSTCG